MIADRVAERMRILAHDYAGHTFQPQLSRELARRGHTVVHAYRAHGHGRQGSLVKRPDDADGLSFVPIALAGRAASRRGIFARVRHELVYGRAVSRVAQRMHADVVLSANTPLIAQRLLLRRTRRNGARFIYWMEDWISVAQTRKAKRKLGRLGVLAGVALRWLERSSLLGSDHVVAATTGFLPALDGYELPPERVTVIPNWAPLDEIEPMPRANHWAIEHDLVDRVVFMYAGSLGLKHEPGLLVDLAQALPDVSVVVVAEGSGADFVASEAARLALSNVLVLRSQPYALLPQVLATADVLVAILDADGGAYSVPSKVLTYLCAQRPILACVPSDRMTGQIVIESEGGVVVEPGAADEFISAARKLSDDAQLRESLGACAREYAVKTFDIRRVADAFESVFESVVGPTSR
jgi:colanic acid biosynthesis glycosyl transferase WcaI